MALSSLDLTWDHRALRHRDHNRRDGAPLFLAHSVGDQVFRCVPFPLVHRPVEGLPARTRQNTPARTLVPLPRLLGGVRHRQPQGDWIESPGNALEYRFNHCNCSLTRLSFFFFSFFLGYAAAAHAPSAHRAPLRVSQKALVARARPLPHRRCSQPVHVPQPRV